MVMMNRFNSDSMNDDRLNPNIRATTMEYLQSASLMFKKCAVMAD
jgi:hypothetical protein